jgi:hypothetical protein
MTNQNHIFSSYLRLFVFFAIFLPSLVKGACPEIFYKVTSMNRIQEVTQPTNYNFSITYQTPNGPIRLEGKRQQELEKRFEIMPSNPSLNVTYRGEQRSYESAEELVKVMLDWDFNSFIPPQQSYRETLRDPKVTLPKGAMRIEYEALKSRQEVVHGPEGGLANGEKPSEAPKNYLIKAENRFGKPEDFTRVLTGEWKVAAFRGAHLRKQEWIVGIQAERSIYYDTPSALLMERGIFLREKIWKTSDGEIRARSVFLKTKPEIEELGLGRRWEYQLPIPLEFSQKDIAKLLLQLLEMKHPELAETLNGLIQPAVELKTTRYGLNLIAKPNPKGRKKIGYMVVDEVRGVDLRTNTDVPRYLQIELEVLPEETFRLGELKPGLRVLFHGLENWLGANDATAEPKALHVVNASR